MGLVQVVWHVTLFDVVGAVLLLLLLLQSNLLYTCVQLLVMWSMFWPAALGATIAIAVLACNGGCYNQHYCNVVVAFAVGFVLLLLILLLLGCNCM